MTTVPYRPPTALLEELGILEPEDIRIEAIAEYCGATILYEPLRGCDARLLGHGDRALITVNSLSPHFRQRFSAAHELGHWMCDRGIVAFACSEKLLAAEWSEDNPERRANRYAAALLLPGRIFARYAKNRETTFATTRDLADLFQTSLTATAIRLVEVGSYPAMVVCLEQGRRRWFIRGPDVPDRLWPRERPTHNTLALDVIQNATRAAGPEDVCADGWFDHPEAPRYAIREDCVRIADDLVLSLLWWKDERQLLDLDQDEQEADDD